ncbi:MAG: Oligoendopeptidase F [uncultured Thermomicrobiales bacterium]|uniref:Oligoendopeptidase F n=1 Tax=uncultured Thermomicrobiales bacterium TaxID=1645740 RepID=A0A6J4UCH4_9BACT|nr:MAG: Oligoendopeptidase F [uncultured Thermomicrobiales bacterium]
MATETAQAALPHWDMTTIYPSVESPEFTQAVAGLEGQIAALEKQAEDLPAGNGTIDDATVTRFEAIVGALDEALGLAMLSEAFVYGFIATNSRDAAAQAKESELRQLFSRMSKIETRLTAWVGSLDGEALIARSPVAAEQAYLVRQSVVAARHLMAQPEEDLAAELTLSGGSAWGKLHVDLTSQLMVPVEKEPGTIVELPMSEIRNLATDPDRGVRERAFTAEIKTWSLWATPIAGALNGVKGEHATLADRRGWNEILDQSLFQNHIDRKTLDAMLGAARAAFPDIRRYLKAKARALGLEQLAWYDLTAPLSSNDKVWSWDEAVAFLNDQFGSYSPKMRELAERAVRERWIDAEPRPGKVGGAFCMPVRDDESRILANYTPAFDGVSTLAHELGHAYHNLCQASVSPLRRMQTPMTLAETASTFCETILRKAAIAQGTEDEQLTILEGALQDASGIVVDITSRFLFESAVCERRKHRELSADEFCELMLDAQRQTYGDGVASDQLHPYMWAVKTHYYSSGYAFYNYPYMFGLLFGLGLYAQYETDPDTFRTNYDALLASTGDADAAELAARFGFDIQNPAFWEGSLSVIKADVDTFVALVDRRAGA